MSGNYIALKLQWIVLGLAFASSALATRATLVTPGAIRTAATRARPATYPLTRSI
jgi:hypothetical protein